MAVAHILKNYPARRAVQLKHKGMLGDLQNSERSEWATEGVQIGSGWNLKLIVFRFLTIYGNHPLWKYFLVLSTFMRHS